jgi:predicted aldo/keto reductase-like oxidoreductase
MINMKAAMKWVLEDENVHTAIPGIVNFDHLNEYLSVMDDLTLTPKERADLEKPAELGMNGLFCPQCGDCVAQCKEGLDIPTLMRSYMYGYGYKNIAKARETLAKVDLKNLPCDNCQSCSVYCSMRFDVKEKISNIANLRHIPENMLG